VKSANDIPLMLNSCTINLVKKSNKVARVIQYAGSWLCCVTWQAWGPPESCERGVCCIVNEEKKGSTYEQVQVVRSYVLTCSSCSIYSKI
jgi:hypothetical protein